jgi:hypothetical protein
VPTRVQNETLGHRGRKHDPLFRWRWLLRKANERYAEGDLALEWLTKFHTDIQDADDAS